MADVRRANNVIRIPTSLQGKFFRIWIEFLTPLLNLANRERDVLAALLKERFELSEKVNDEELLDKIVLGDDIREKIKTQLGISDTFFKAIIAKLKKVGIIVNNRINTRLIPKHVTKDDKSFQFLLYFDLDAGDN